LHYQFLYASFQFFLYRKLFFLLLELPRFYIVSSLLYQVLHHQTFLHMPLLHFASKLTLFPMFESLYLVFPFYISSFQYAFYQFPFLHVSTQNLTLAFASVTYLVTTAILYGLKLSSYVYYILAFV